MTKNLILSAAACLPLFLFSQSVRKPLISSYSSFGAYSVKQADLFSATHNQASLCRVKSLTAGMLAERRFMLSELSFYKMALALPVPGGGIEVNTVYAGSFSLHEMNTGLAFARSLGKKMDIGIQFNYYGLKTAGYGKAGAVTAEAGALFHLTDKLTAGMHLYNPFRSLIGKSGEERLAAVYTVGMGYDISSLFFIGTEIQQEENEPVNIHTGFQYHPLPSFLIRAGINSSTAEIYLGTGIYLNDFRVDITSHFHPQLGVTPGISLIYEKNKSKMEK